MLNTYQRASLALFFATAIFVCTSAPSAATRTVVSANDGGNVTIPAQKSGVTKSRYQRKFVSPQSIVGAPFTFNNAGNLNIARAGHTATLLQNGKVLVAGGFETFGQDTGNIGLATAELYDPASGTWTATGSLNAKRDTHTATLLPNGKVLVAAGGDFIGELVSAELYDPASGTWAFTGSLATGTDTHMATLLPNGKVLVVGGFLDGNGNVTARAELYDPASGTWTATGSLNTARAVHTAILLTGGKVLVTGGADSFGNALASAELYDPASGSWTATGNLNTARLYHTATLLPNGKVLAVGGLDSSNSVSASAELYDPATGTWTATGSLNTARYVHTATLLPNGKVLVAGGADSFDNTFTSAELYDPASGTWTATGSLNAARSLHTAALLPNGKVLVAGGYTGGMLGAASASAELYDPASGTWTGTGSLNTARYDHTATLLPNGKVLVAGGFNVVGVVTFASAELYDPASGTWTFTGNLNTARLFHTATLLPNGKVLAVGGLDSSNSVSASAELYDPATGTWTTTGNLNTARYHHTATLLPNGKVLVAGGADSFDNALASAELYDPASGTWTATGSLNTARDSHTATLLPNGKVLVAGGSNPSASAELYDTGLGFVRPDWQPQIATITSPLISSLSLTGSRFKGISQASGGTVQDSSTNYPLVQLRNIDNSQVAFLSVNPTAGWSDTSFTSIPITDFPAGPALVTVFANGIPSDSKYLVVSPLIQTSVVSRMAHGSIIPPFDIPLPLTGPRGVECRSSASLGAGNYTVVFTFVNNMTSCGTAGTTGGSVSSGPNLNQCTENLTGVPNAHYLTVTLNSVVDAQNNTGNVSAPMGVLIGDVDGSGRVDSTDVFQVRQQTLQNASSSNFRTDVDASGRIDSTDVFITRQQTLTALPSTP